MNPMATLRATGSHPLVALGAIIWWNRTHAWHACMSVVMQAQENQGAFQVPEGALEGRRVCQDMART